MVGAAVKVTDVPSTMLLAEADAVTLGVRFGFTVIATLLLVAVAAVWQVLFAVITQVLASLFANPASV